MTPITEKKCTRTGCDKVKPIKEFHKNVASQDGFHYYCKECIRLLNQENVRRRMKRTEQLNREISIVAEEIIKPIIKKEISASEKKKILEDLKRKQILGFLNSGNG